MAGKKRMRDGEVKTSQLPQENPVTDPTPRCAQPQVISSASTESQSALQTESASAEHTESQQQASESAEHAQAAHSKTKSRSRPKKDNSRRQKLPKLPANAIVSRRPLLHPALPTPFSSPASPKILYITTKSPFIPALKRIRKLLAEITNREKQSSGATSKNARKRGPPEANGRLTSGDVERGVVDEMTRSGSKSKEGEKVYLKAAGRAISRALELGVQFQGDGDYAVKVEIGSVKAIDDIEVQTTDGGEAGEKMEEEIPETRLRTISSVTVSIGSR